MVEKNHPRLTHQSLMVLQVLMEDLREPLSGADIRRRTQLFSGTLYPIMLRFEDAGIVSSRWEDGDPHQLGRPRKRLYRITGEGAKIANDAFKSLRLPQGDWVRT